MNTEAKLHPSVELLTQFVQGELATGNSVVVSAHMELCTSCSDKADELHAAIDGLDDADARVKAGTALDQAQASWRSYMDATCSLEGEIASATGSADASYAEDACEIRYSKARADYLGSLSARFASGEN